MHISKTDFDRATTRVPLPAGQADALWRELQTVAQPAAAGVGSRFDFAHVTYYFGALVVLGAMGWFMSNAWEAFGGAGICLIALAYALGFAGLGGWLWRRSPAWRTPAGLLVTLAVGMTPLTVYGLERWLGWWPADDPGKYSGFHVWINGSWIVMELATIFTSLVAMRFVRFPFLTAPIAFALWYLSMDVAPLLLGRTEIYWEERAWISLGFGAAMMLLAFVADVRRGWRGLDHGFWLALFGVIAFWGGLTCMNSSSEWGTFGYALINAGLMLLGVVLDRRAYTVFGALGVFGYIGHLAWDLFANSPLFPFALSGFGLLVIAAGVVYQRKHETLRRGLLAALPGGLCGWLPRGQEDR